MTVQVVYDLAVFLSCLTGEVGKNLQQLVKKPELYIIALSSSSPSDQLAIIPDRLDDLYELSRSTRSSRGIEVHDTARFFIGDHPAQQFESGSCGCPDVHMGDFACACQCEWCSLAELQALVLAGKYGSRVGTLKAFAGLKVGELREELHARGIWDTDKPKKELEGVLTQTLRGAQRVPSLLITNPKQSLEDLNLSRYTVLDCEPLHDLKGHLQHLLTPRFVLSVRDC